MRVAPIVLWILASILWLPWALLLVRLLADLALGTAASQSPYLAPALQPIAPSYGWRGWHITSGFPILALLAFGLSATAWRIQWLLRDGLLRRTAFQRGASILVPPLALLFAWRDARAEHLEHNAELQADAEEASDRLAARH